MLLSHLPREGAVGRAIHGDAAEWTVERELLASLVDITSLHRWQHAMVNFKRVSKTPPEPVTRPTMQPQPRGRAHRPSHVQREPRRHMTHSEMADLFGIPLRKPTDNNGDDGEGGGVDGD